MVDNKENDKFDLGVKGLIRYLFFSSNKRERFQLKGPLNLVGLTLRYHSLNKTILGHILPERYNNITLSSIFFSQQAIFRKWSTHQTVFPETRVWICQVFQTKSVKQIK